jgi:hypothetical protein
MAHWTVTERTGVWRDWAMVHAGNERSADQIRHASLAVPGVQFPTSPAWSGIARLRYGIACGVLLRRFAWPCVMAAALATASPVASGADQAAATAARSEVEALLSSLETGDCRFRRNGTWHTGAEARAHLTRKWKELDRRQLAGSTEAFIEHGASSSMMSGEHYLVQCGSAAAQLSRTWLMARLGALRGQRP